MRKSMVAAAAVLGLLVAMLSGPIPASARGGCRAFGQNVAGLAQLLGPDFGATASGVASSDPGAFPELVVHPEQQQLCP
jgi:hypothetical protein